MVQLKEIQAHTKTAAGLEIPLNDLAETEGGKVTTRPSKLRYYAEGIVITAGSLATKKLAEENVTLSPGDTVLVSKQVLNSDSFHFYTDRSKPVQDFKGLICIPHTLIEAKI